MLTVEQCFAADLGNVPPILDFVTENAAAAGLHPRRVKHLELAAEEAVANICNYAYEVPPGQIWVRMTQDASEVRVDFIDNGVPFDPLKAEAPDLQAGLEEREVGGLGIFFIRRFLDEVRYSRQGDKNVLTLVIRHESN